MIKNFAKHLVSWQIRKGYLYVEKEGLYTYAYELLIGQVVNLLIACFLAFVFHAYVTVLVYLLVFIPLRSYAGGHHADTYFICSIISACFICAVCAAVKMIPLQHILQVNLLGAFVSGGLLFFLAPVEDYNKPLDIKEKIYYRKRSIGVWMLETVVWVLFYLMGFKTISLIIVLGHITLSILLCLGLLKNKYSSLKIGRE